MAQQHPGGPPRIHRGAKRWAVAGLAVAALTTGCSSETVDLVQRGWMPGERDTTNITPIVESLWVGSWIAALVLGVLVWGLTIWAVVRYRRRKDETGLPPQLRYNVPLEILYTVVPLFVIGVLFFYTARDELIIEERYDDPEVTVEVVGKQWGWDVNYTDSDVYDTGTMAPDGPDGVDPDAPVVTTIYVPVDRTVEFVLRTRDVNHSFWVPAFSYKKDLIAGRTNYMSVTPQREGTYIGRCAELCGEFHSRMLFKVAVVSQDEYDQHLDDLRAAGQTGSLPADLGRVDPDEDQEEDQIGEERGGLQDEDGLQDEPQGENQS